MGLNLFGGETGAGKEARRIAEANFTDFRLQKFLPPSLRFEQTGGILKSGIQGIGELIKTPGRLSSSVADAIRQRLAGTSENIAANFRGIRANQAGASARSNTPISIKNALSGALDVAQERAQRGARRGALEDTDKLRRQDLGQTFGILDAILQFLSSGRGQAVQGLDVASRSEESAIASRQALIGSVGSSLAGRPSS